VEKALSSTTDCSNTVDPTGCVKAHAQVCSQDLYRMCVRGRERQREREAEGERDRGRERVRVIE
jgi:hypothetical protein